MLIGFCITIGCITMAFQDSSNVKTKKQHAITDTVPGKKNNFDFDKKDFDKSFEEMNKELENAANKIKDIDFEKLSQQIQESIKKIDLDKIKVEIENSMKKVDMDKIKADIRKSMKEIDYEKISADVQRAVKDATASINTEEIRKELEQLKTLNLEEIKGEMNNAREEMEKNKDKIKQDLEKAKEEMKNTKSKLSIIKTITFEMGKDGLINPDGDYTIEYKDKVLKINGKQQSQEITDKYREYFNGEDFRIHKKKE